MDFHSAAISNMRTEEIIPAPSRNEGMAGPSDIAVIVDSLEKLPVINAEFSAANLRDLDAPARSKLVDYPPSSVFLGIGLCTTKELSRGLPFDVIGQICAAEWTRRILNYDRILIVIADVHAKINIEHKRYDDQKKDPGSSKKEDMDLIDHTAMINREILKNIAKALGIPKSKIEIKLASEIVATEEYIQAKDLTKKVLADEKIPPSAKAYVHEQSATIEWARLFQGMRAKISWLAVGNEGERTSKTFDEVFFDTAHARNFGKLDKLDDEEGGSARVNHFNIIGTDPGYTFWGSQPIVPPYVLLGRTMQIAIEEATDCRLVVAKAAGNSERAAAGFAANFPGIIQSAEMLLGKPLQGRQWVDKANSLLDLIYADSPKRANIRGRSIQKSLRGTPEYIKDLMTFQRTAGYSR